ncbi:MAG: carbohydrate kinase family protein, partial [bacterium]
MKDIVCIGGVTHDIFFKSKFQSLDGKLSLPWGEKVVVDDMAVALGGGGANAAVGFSRLGLKTALLARVGVGHISQSVVEQLKKEKVDTTWVIKDPQSYTATSVLLLDTVSGERTIVMYRGRNDFFDIEVLDVGRLLDTRWLYIADLALSDDSNSFIEELT